MEESTETLEDLILQIWNNGAEGEIYDALDIQELENRIITCVNHRDTQNVCR